MNNAAIENRSGLLLSLTLAMAVSTPASALETKKTEPSQHAAISELATLGSTITQLQNQITMADERSVKTTIEIERLDKALSNTRQLLAKNIGHINDLTNNLKQLDRQIAGSANGTDKANRSVQRQQQALQRQRQPRLLAAALGDPETIEIQREMAIQHYLLHRATTAADMASQALHKLEVQKNAHQSEVVALRSLVETQQRQFSQIQIDKIAAENLLAKITTAIADRSDKLEKLESRAHRMEAFTSEDASRAFFALKGQLPDPTTGTLSHSFAEPKARGLLKWNGIVIEAPLGQDVQAVYDGKVVFADELQGLGNVSIVDHGSGYMSLYGGAELLLVQAGQMVLAGDVVARVGESVGSGSSALYFEIRHNANTLNPQQWLSMKKIRQLKIAKD